MKKIKILHCSETSHAASGFGIYTKELMNRLVENDRLKLAEQSCYTSVGDSRHIDSKWRIYPNAIDNNHPLKEQYASNPANKYGEWRFERILVDFKPDIVFDIRDPWMLKHETKSPLRPFFHHCIMPTVDSAPQQESWIEMFRDADAVFTYADWAIKVLDDQSNNQIATMQAAYPGVDLDVFKPLNKSELKNRLGIPQDSFIVGTTMRNQRRKHFPDLCEAIKIFYNKYKDTEIGKKTYFYMHTSYPDVGWDLPELLRDNGIANKVFFTYICRYSKTPMALLFEGAKTYSPFSNALSATLPSVGFGLDRNQLAAVYNLFDLYVQYASCEGFGMPQAEAAACGVPVAAIDYSAMSDVVKITDGIPLKPKKMFLEWETKAQRAYPDNNHTADAIYKYLSRDQEYKDTKSRKARKAAETYFNWDRTAKIWSDYFENVQLTGLQGKWDSPPIINLNPLPTEIPQNLSNVSNTAFVDWLCREVAREPDLFFKLEGLEALKKLNWAIVQHGIEMKPFTRQDLFKDFAIKGNNKLTCEKARLGMFNIQSEDYIQFANLTDPEGTL